MDNGKKNASKVLTTNDIREDARNWTLAGDVGLLAHLEQFSENVISKTQETQKRFSELVDDYEELYTKVGNITNQFLALQNCQFVENRVYDEETPTEEKAEVKVQNEVEQEKLLLMQYKEAVEVGIKLLDTHFQEVQLPPNSDSDDDEDEVSTGNSVIWKPKNPYAGRKFPLLIGSAEWWADDHVGLGAEEDILDTEKIISESESDMESLKSVDKEMKSSSSSSMEQVKSIPTKPAFLDSSSEDLFGLDKKQNLKNSTSDDFFFKGSNSLLDQPENFLPDIGKEAETETVKRVDSFGDIQPPQPVDEAEAAPISQTKKVDNAFTRELMAKLSSVTNKKETEVKEKEKKGTEDKPPAARPTKSCDNFFDETDDSSDLFLTKPSKTMEIPVANKGLFFDAENDDELFKGENDLFSGGSLFESNGLKKPKSQSIGGNVLGALQEPEMSPKTESVVPKKNSVRDLFNDLDDDYTLFATPKADSIDSSYKSAPKSDVAAGLAWDNEDGLLDSTNSQIEDDLFGSSGLFDASASAASPESRSKKAPVELFPEKPQGGTKTETDFDDSGKKESSIFGSPIVGVKESAAKELFDDPFGFSQSKEPSGKKISILNSEDDDDYLFSKGPKEEKKLAVRVTAFPEDEDTALFVEKPKPPDSASVSSSRSSLFDDVSVSKSRLASVFDKDKSGNKTEDDLFSLTEDSLFGGDTKAGKDLFSEKVKDKEKSSLFDDCYDGDDLFGSGKNSGGQKSMADVSEEFKKQERHKAKAFVDDLGDDDLFRTSGTSTKLRETKSDILRQTEHKLFADDLNDADLFSTKPAEVKPKPPSSLSLKPTECEAKGKTVGKLNIPDNLKVKFESAAKHISPGGVRLLAEEKKEEVKKDEKEDKDEVLDEPPQPSNLLKCPSKDRVKIPGRRRPQSRRARQEAIRNSGVWDQPTSPRSNLSTPHPSKDSLASPVVSNPLSPSTDEEDFFKVPELDTNFEKEDQSIFKCDLFESSKSSKPDDGLLFDGAPVLSPLSSRKAEVLANKSETDILFAPDKPKPASIFDDDDDDDLNGDDNDHDNLFKATKPLEGQFPAKSEEKVKKSLFEQDSDDDSDDLFGGKSHAAPSKPFPAGKMKEDSEGKSRGSSTFVDPLGLITKD